MTHRIKYRTLNLDFDGDAPGSQAPWYFEERTGAVKSIHPRTGMRPAGDPFPLVCRLPNTYTTQLVDGHLLAAAPEMFDALEAVLLEDLPHTKGCDDNPCVCYLDRVRKAYYKAMKMSDPNDEIVKD